jgi:hypothetical protein
MFDIERTVRQRTDTTDTLTSQIALGSALALSIKKYFTAERQIKFKGTDNCAVTQYLMLAMNAAIALKRILGDIVQSQIEQFE